MGKRSKRPGRAGRTKQASVAVEERGRYQAICPRTGTPVFTTCRQDAVNAAAQLGTYFFYEMDAKGPFLESIAWVWLMKPDPGDSTSVIATRHLLEELECRHSAA